MLQYKYELVTLSENNLSHELEKKLNEYSNGRRIVSMTHMNGIYTFLLEDTYDTRELSE